MKRARRKDSKYDPAMCDMVIEVANEGGFHAAMMLKIGVSKGTFRTYRQEYPEFDNAVQQADLIIQAKTEKVVVDISENRKAGDFKAAAFILQTKFNQEYPRDGNELTPTSITINNLTITNEERDYKIMQLSEKLRSSGYDLSQLMNPLTKIIEQAPSDDCPED
jgi:hypothetical protein